MLASGEAHLAKNFVASCRRRLGLLIGASADETLFHGGVKEPASIMLAVLSDLKCHRAVKARLSSGGLKPATGGRNWAAGVVVVKTKREFSVNVVQLARALARQ